MKRLQKILTSAAVAISAGVAVGVSRRRAQKRKGQSSKPTPSQKDDEHQFIG